MTSQPERISGWPDGSGSGAGPPAPGDGYQVRPVVRPRRGRRRLAFTLLLVLSLVGLAVSAVGVAHQVLPRRFTAAQRQEILTWEMQRRWRDLPAAQIFPASQTYELFAGGAGGLGSHVVVKATRLGISPEASCAVGLTTVAVQVVASHGCSVTLRATYVDSSGSIVATLAVAVLGDTAGGALASDLTGLSGETQAASTASSTAASAGGSTGSSAPAVLVRAYPVPGTQAAGFDTASSSISQAAGSGPYVVMATAGLADGRGGAAVAGDSYLSQEMGELASGLIKAALSVLGTPLPAPTCPGAPGC